MSDSNVQRLSAAMEQAAEKKQKAATRLVELAKGNGVELFHTPDGDAFASVIRNGRRENWPVGSSDFRSFLTELFMVTEHSAPPSQALSDAINTLHAEGRFRGECHAVYVRRAQVGEAIFIDIGDEARTVFKVEAGQWQQVADPPVRFRRPKGMLALPMPLPGGTLDELATFLNVPNPSQFKLLLVWLVTAFFMKGPFAFLVFQGLQGSAKTTTARVLRRLCDPNKADVRSQPRTEQDLVISARNAMLLVFDNISNITDAMSDALCRLSTGGGFATRELYTDQDEVIFDVCRPAILTGIDSSVTRSDLLDRCVLVELPPIDGTSRRTEREFWAQFDAAAPRLFGAVLDLLARMLPLLDEARERLTERPRMADFHERGLAVELALGWEPGTFKAAYEGNQASANDIAIESSLIGAYICELAATKFEGTPTELLNRLDQMFDQQGAPRRPWSDNPVATAKRQRPKGWPTSTKALKNQLTRLLPNLNARGVDVTFWQTAGSGSKKMVSITQAEAHLAQPEAVPGEVAVSAPVATDAPIPATRPVVPVFLPAPVPFIPQPAAPIAAPAPFIPQLPAPVAVPQAGHSTTPVTVPLPLIPQLPAPVPFIPQRPAPVPVPVPVPVPFVPQLPAPVPFIPPPLPAPVPFVPQLPAPVPLSSTTSTSLPAPAPTSDVVTAPVPFQLPFLPPVSKS